MTDGDISGRVAIHEILLLDQWIGLISCLEKKRDGCPGVWDFSYHWTRLLRFK